MKDNDKQRRGRVASREELLKKSSRRDPSRREGTRRQTSEEEPVRKKTASQEARQRAAERPHHTSDERRRSDERIPQQTTQRVTSQKQGTKRRKKKKNKLKRYYRLIIVMIIFVLILAIPISGIIRLFSGSKGSVRRAYAKTVSMYEKKPSVTEKILGKDVTKLMKTGNYSQNFRLGVTDNTAGIQGLGISGSMNKNTSGKTADIQLSAGYSDTDVIGLKMFTDNKQILLSAPGIYDSWLSIDCDKNVSQLSQSALGKKIEFSDERDFPLKLFDEQDDQGEIIVGLGEQFKTIFTKQADSLSKKAAYKRIKEKKVVLIDGAEKRLRGYELTINGDDFKNFLVNIISDVRKNKKIKAYLTNYAKIQFKEWGFLSKLYDSPDYLVDTYYKQIDDTMEKIRNSEFVDTKAEIYIYKGVIADIHFSTVYTIDQDQMKIDLTGGMYGGKKPYEDLSLNLSLSDDKRALNIGYAEETDNIDSAYTHKRSFVLGDGNEDLTVDTKVTYDKSTGVLNGSANLKTPSGGYIDLNGSGSLNKANGITQINAQEIKLDYNSLFTLIMDGSYDIGALSAKPQKPDGEVTDLFTADEAQLNAIQTTVTQNIDAVFGKIDEVLTKLIVKPETQPADGQTTENGENTETSSESTEGAAEETTEQAETTEQTENAENAENTDEAA